MLNIATPVFNLPVVKCYCETKNGAPGKNRIMCVKEGRLQTTSHCASDEWCTGPVNAEDAIDESKKTDLCDKGKFEMARYPYFANGIIHVL